MFCSRSLGRGGVTLVEMMIALIITLMIVFAMVQAFSRIGETTADGRATIEMLGQIRHCRVLMEEDISRCTIPVEMRDPRALSPDQYHGYFELVEGTGSDSAPGRYLVRTPAGLKYNSFNNFIDPNNPLAAESRTLFGDLDEILCMTIRNDDVHFRGRFADAAGVINVIESNLAEVLWWAELNDQPQDVNGDGVITAPVDVNNDGFLDFTAGDTRGEGGYGEWDPGETFTIRRRVLLIRPDLTIPPSMTVPQFLANNDVSVHYHYDATTGNFMDLRANSLGDLTFRWNRTAHVPINGSPMAGPPATNNAFGLTALSFLSPIDPTQLPAYASASMRGEDVVLSNVLGFDFRVWDPNAPVCDYNPGVGVVAEGLVPGDPGFAPTITATPDASRPSPPPGTVGGRGAFVDLGALALDPVTYNAAAIGANNDDDDGDGDVDELDEIAMNPHFLGVMQARSYLPLGNYVYDPWTAAYESDRFDQDQNGVADQGTNGLDDDGTLGPDDENERETSPPYPFPLKLLQVRIRMYESDTRQVKQVSQNIQFAK